MNNFLRVAVGALAVSTIAAVTSAAPAVSRTPDQSPRITAVGSAAAATPAPGTGWLLVLIDTSTRNGESVKSQRLQLISPTGARTTVWRQRPSTSGDGFVTVSGWSSDGKTALLHQNQGLPSQAAVVVDVPTGTATSFPLKRDLMTISLAADGSRVIGATYQKRNERNSGLVAYTLAGARTDLGTRVAGTWLNGEDGTIIAGHERWKGTGLRVLAADGRVIKRIPTSVHCIPVRTWNADNILISCAKGYRSPLLGLANIDSGAVRMLTLRHPADSNDYGDLDARSVGNMLFLQVAGPCGYTFVARGYQDGRLKELKIPGSTGNVIMVSSSDSKLTLQHSVSCDGDGTTSALTSYDTATKEETILFKLPKRSLFDDTWVYGEQKVAY